MSNQTITIPNDTDSVTLNIERNSNHHAPTLRDMIEATALDMAIRVIVKDSHFKWNFDLPKQCEEEWRENPSDRVAAKRRRMAFITSSDLTDLDELLDHRIVRIVKSDFPGRVCFEVGVHV